MRVEAVARQHGRSVQWRPFLLGPIFREQGWTDSPFNTYPVKGRYMWRDLERICAALALPFQKPTQFPRNGLLAARAVCAGEGEAWLPQFVRKVYSANFADDRDIADPSVLLDCLRGLAPDPGRVLAAAREDVAKTRLRHNGERAIGLGVFGAPTFVVDDEIFWGNDRLETALAWAR
jgi:2-hydroxychromene-2-carboxylate isomerase